ncbi:hypothetical protein [Bowmanella sp. JS7-9]|uniref:Lipoprotein n=1 Tax=Pseudobowmanella zhangzhouensis TaxID=1537679 RepID=A0ABW1XFY3_9ALTE|nr:hypothetical protein [Bowmanella sp. JS7-9]TBX21439.1 hypothetical protein TK45_11945 [Bowmanella sp. JS7-9]
MKTHLTLILCTLALTGCSHRSLYETGQNYQKSQCIIDAQTPEQIDACRQANNMSYEEYKKAREALAKQPTPEK